MTSPAKRALTADIQVTEMMTKAVVAFGMTSVGSFASLLAGSLVGSDLALMLSIELRRALVADEGLRVYCESRVIAVGRVAGACKSSMTDVCDIEFGGCFLNF